MSEGDINPHYEVFRGESGFGISGKELTTEETVLINRVSENEEFAKGLAAVLGDKKVSVHHAKDVIRDMLLAYLE